MPPPAAGKFQGHSAPGPPIQLLKAADSRVHTGLHRQARTQRERDHLALGAQPPRAPGAEPADAALPPLGVLLGAAADTLSAAVSADSAAGWLNLGPAPVRG